MTSSPQSKNDEDKQKHKQRQLFEKDPVIVELEHSLIAYLSNKKEVEQRVNGGIRRVRSLRFNILVKDINDFYFSVQIGMCEALFNSKTGLRERGHCFGMERLIRDWFERPSVQFKIDEVVKKQIMNIKKAG